MISTADWMILLALITTAVLMFMFVNWLEEHYPWLFIDDIRITPELMAAEEERYGRFLNMAERHTKLYLTWYKEWRKSQ